MESNLWALIAVACIFAAIGIAAGIMLNNWIQKLQKDSASRTADKIRSDAEREAEHILRDARVSAKAETIKMREECEQELKERRREQTNNEKRLAQREELLDRRADSMDAKSKNIEKQEKEIETLRERLGNREQELAKSISQQIDELERIAGMKREEARGILLEKLKNEIKNESGLMVRNQLEEAKARSEREARRILTYAIQRYASDCTYERTTATIPLPNDEMKGRIIGREGRNIRAIEAATGVSILIDDTPEAVVISCFDPVRKEVARQLMERLISDGRIHPTRVEELAKKISKELEEELFQVGEAAVLETGIQGVSPQIMKLLGRLKYRYSFSQNVLQHSLETSYFMGMIAAELGLDARPRRAEGEADRSLPRPRQGDRPRGGGAARPDRCGSAAQAQRGEGCHPRGGGAPRRSGAGKSVRHSHQRLRYAERLPSGGPQRDHRTLPQAAGTARGDRARILGRGVLLCTAGRP